MVSPDVMSVPLSITLERQTFYDEPSHDEDYADLLVFLEFVCLWTIILPGFMTGKEASDLEPKAECFDAGW